jgi:hypothetical protein
MRTWCLSEDIAAWWRARKLASGRLLGGELVDIGYDVIFIKYAHHACSFDKGLSYALGIYLFHPEFSNQEYI